MTTIDQPQQESLDDSRMTLGEHLSELRTRLIRSVLAIGVCFIVAWIFRSTLTEWAYHPHLRSIEWLREYKIGYLLENASSPAEAAEGFTPDSWKAYEATDKQEVLALSEAQEIRNTVRTDAAGSVFFIHMKVCFYFALFIGGPVLLWQVWQFVAAGLYKHEKTVIHRYFPFSVGLFVSGVLFGYFMMVPNALYFLSKMSVGEERFEYWQSADIYWHFLTALTLALGAVFQLPVLMLALTRIGLVEASMYPKYRAHMAVGSLVLSAMLTPPDPVTQLMMAIPIIFLYELGSLVARFTQPAPPPETAGAA
ncbi:MAG: twin-arginine translocase subunit TatC [bacterium]|nr:twin-arginine translocase subunit TatC [bacterium]